MATLYKGEIGKTIQARFVRVVGGEVVALDISAAATKELRIKKPNGVYVEFALTFVTDGSDGLARYVTASASDLDVSGLWFIQGHAVGAGFDYFTEEETILVGSVNPEP